MTGFRAFRIDRQDKKIVAGFCTMAIDELTDGDVVIKVSHSTINYKDALAATGAGRILRTYPLNGGIDLAGVVVSSEDDRFAEDDVVEGADVEVIAQCRLAFAPQLQHLELADFVGQRLAGIADVTIDLVDNIVFGFSSIVLEEVDGLLARPPHVVNTRVDDESHSTPHLVG